MSPVPKVGKVDAVVGADVLCEGGILPLTAHSGPQASQHTTRSAASTGGAHLFSFLPRLWKSTSNYNTKADTYLLTWKKLISGRQCCGSGSLSRILIFVHPGSRIQKQQQKRKVKKILFFYIFLQPQISSNCKLFYFWTGKEKNWAILQRTFYPKNCQ